MTDRNSFREIITLAYKYQSSWVEDFESWVGMLIGMTHLYDIGARCLAVNTVFYFKQVFASAP